MECYLHFILSVVNAGTLGEALVICKYDLIAVMK